MAGEEEEDEDEEDEDEDEDEEIEIHVRALFHHAYIVLKRMSSRHLPVIDARSGVWYANWARTCMLVNPATR